MSSSNNNQHLPSTSSSDLPPQQNATAPHLDANAQLANNGYATTDNQLAGLVEAATAAADQDVSQWAAAAAVAAAAGAAGHHHQLDSYTDMDLSENGFGDGKFDNTNFASSLSSGRHMRVPSHTGHAQSSGLTRTATKKRKRNDDNLDPALAGAGLAASQHQSHPVQQTPHGYTGEGIEIRPEQQQSLSDARAVGIHSAAALFRQPSSNKKYTRPPISKMFSSLEISPENFLHLQAAAKNYMLDDEHPERRDCVGQRGKGDTEMVKLRLWNCVRQFLEAEGNGERFFGENVVNEGMGPRTYIWPRDQHKIISLVIPLLRRMVTNERQRQYAIETRKGGGSEERRRRKTDEFSNLNSPFSPHQHQHLQMQNQTPHRDDMSQSLAPPPQPMQQALEPPQPMNLGLTDLILDGYTADWEEIGRYYDTYNENFELDNLWSLSGLQQPDWRGIVAAVDSHYQVVHNGHYECPPPCENGNINRILHADSTSGLQWRIGGGGNSSARYEFASSITRDVSRVIRENIASQHGHPTQTPDTHFHQPFSPLPESAPANNANTSSQNQGQTSLLRVNILHNGKRILPRFDLPAGQCPNIDSVKQAILRRYPGQIPGLSAFQDGHANNADARESAAAGWKVKVWLPDGLMDVQSQKDWAIAVLSADAVDWMDGELKVLVEIDGEQQ
ncbi:uncharacterized protein N7515_008382 [Penicillium bovifimosum]|uniref:Uncharacterized protein n=1 Tax=Penicillium bovifimosum TaxID=126998 RepID=A0A9W9KXG2_9EURO|nr:uncharacterized protein N7515_008382 [Penicillium bovifimosum]KAJ5124557.1 hypothetical protein N7515_008382 [Penicillium bovifimosum]